MTQFKRKKITLTGVLVPDQWAKDGEITGFALCTDDEQKYVLRYSTENYNLTLMLHQSIKVNGVVTGDAEEKSIIVTALKLLSSREIAARELRGNRFVTGGLL